MFRFAFRFLAVPALAALIASSIPPLAHAGTTGHITGRVVDSQTQAPLSGVVVTASSPSQNATATTDASGTYRFLSLAPDSYTIGYQLEGYDPVSQAGISVFADQTQTVNVPLVKTLKTIAKVTSRSTGNLIKPGTTSDVYSVNATQAAAAASLAGPGGLSNAYGAIASIPGVAVDTGEAGWFQQVHIRGGDIDQVGYELDGIPVNRVYDNAPQTMLSSLGQQELQVYTGGTPASADAQGIAGYVNQVVKTGTYPGFGVATLSAGSPAFFHRASFEAGGSIPSRLFSYYIGIAGADQGYRYYDNSNGAGVPYSFFYPINTFVGGSDVYVGGNKPGLFAPGNTFGIATTSQRDTVMNFHFALPHHNSGLRDDIQLLYLTSEVQAGYYSSPNDISAAVVGAPSFAWNDGTVYDGTMFQPVTPSGAVPYFFPSSPTHPFGALFDPSTRDTNDNGVAVAKLQYQHAFSDRAFLRIYGYTLYSNWFIHGPVSAQEAFGAELADYEIPDHTFGGNISLTDQLSNQHLLSIAASYTGANLQRYSNGFVRSNPNVATLVDASGNCYVYQPLTGPVVPNAGSQTLCYDPAAQLGASSLAGGLPPTQGTAAANNAQFLATSSGIVANLNQVNSRFSSVNITDEWRPNDHFVFNGGLRVENFKYLLGDTRPNDPARAFWFSNYNKDFCFGPGDTSPVLGSFSAGSVVCPNAGEQTLAALGSGAELTDTSSGSLSTTRFEPRLSFTYTLNPDTVLRGSYGVYARPQNTSWVQYDTVQEDLPSFLGAHFYSYGFRSPEHDIRPDTSYNADFSLEKHLHGTDMSFKITPFYRSTKDQLQNFFIDPLTGLESGLNVGHQVSSGVELALQKGDFSRNGLAGQLAFTYTHSRIQYHNFDNSTNNVIDNLNTSIQQYNSYTKTCIGANPTPGAAGYNPLCGTYGGSNAQASFVNSTSGAIIDNPYIGSTAQPLLGRDDYYTTYDVIPGPFSAANGYETPYVASLILNYKENRFSITPSFQFSSGAKYGSPLVWPGYVPQGCTATLSGAPSGAADPATCSSPTGLPLFIPDVYTGKFDNLGDFKQPWRFQASVSLGYEINSHVNAHLTLTNLVDHCGQRGYAWDQANVCVYSALPSGIFAPAGNFYPNSNGSAPPQMQFPYTFYLNNNNTGFVGTRLPMEATFDLQFKL